MNQTGPVPVLFCHYTADVHGGSDLALYELVTHIPRHRIAPHMVLRKGDPLIPAYRDAGVPVSVVRLYPPRRGFEPIKLARFFLFYWPSVFRIAWIIRRTKSRVVHVNTLNNLQGPMAARIARRPLVWHVRELIPKSRLNRYMRGLVKRWAAMAVAISSAVADSLIDCKPRLTTVFDSIDLSDYADVPSQAEARKTLQLPPTAPILICVGRLEPWKGQHVLLDAMFEVLKAHPEARLLIVGGQAVNKPDYLPKLQAQCKKLEIENHVRFLGIRHDVPALIAASDLLVLPSVTPEPFGRTIVEAMAAGRPVVATRDGGPRDTIDDGKTGRLADAGDPYDLARQIRYTLDDLDAAREMGRKGQAIVRERFDLSRVVLEMTTLFEKVDAEARTGK